jgi:hypothetical protein
MTFMPSVPVIFAGDVPKAAHAGNIDQDEDHVSLSLSEELTVNPAYGLGPGDGLEYGIEEGDAESEEAEELGPPRVSLTIRS